jgi:predicted RNase H-like HicB family nuclease
VVAEYNILVAETKNGWIAWSPEFGKGIKGSGKTQAEAMEDLASTIDELAAHRAFINDYEYPGVEGWTGKNTSNK